MDDGCGNGITRRELLRRGFVIGGAGPAVAALLLAQGCGGVTAPAPAPSPTGGGPNATMAPPPTVVPTAPPTAIPTVATAAVATGPAPTGTAAGAASPAVATVPPTVVAGGSPTGAVSPAATVATAPAPMATATAGPVPAVTASPAAAPGVPPTIRAIYLNPDVIIDEAAFNGLLALADRTEINAMVLDVKEESGLLYHQSGVALAREIGAVRPRFDLPRRLATLKAHGVYSIARIVCMQDPTLAAARPALAVRNSKTGGAWENYGGVAWVNAMRPEVWEYNAAVAVEAARLGFDEIQYDYVRFPSDGDMAAIDLGVANTLTARTEAIAQFLKLTRDALAPSGRPLAADIFGIVLLLPDDNNIGQQLERLATEVDYLCPMIYPSHFPPNALGWRVPNDHPYEMILESLQLGGERIADAERKFRPWLQDFSYGRGIEYGPEQVRAQIQATNDFGAGGWMLWNAASTFSEGALLPEGR